VEMPAGGDRHLQGEVRSPGGEPGDHRGKTVYHYFLVWDTSNWMDPFPHADPKVMKL